MAGFRTPVTGIIPKPLTVSGFAASIAIGTVPGWSAVAKFGRNTGIDTATDPEDVWTQGGLWVAPTTARLHDITGGAADDVGGTGMRTVRIFGLDSAWALQQEDITLTGAVAVATASTYTRIFRMYGLTYGSGQTNGGAILATAQTDGTVTASIAAGQGQTLMAIYSVPTGHTAFVCRLWATANKATAAGAGDATLRLLVRGNLDTATPGWNVKRTVGLNITGTSALEEDLCVPLSVTGPADIRWEVEAVRSNNTDISAGFDLLLRTD